MKYISSTLFLLFLLTGCSKITDVIDRDPPNNLVPENAAQTAEGARHLLNGAYSILHDPDYYMLLTEVIPGVQSGAMAKNGFLVNLQFQDNAVLPDLGDVNNCWIILYKMINQANWVIQLTAELPSDEMTTAEKEAIIAQARALRAMAHFDALRLYGQFFDISSPYGIIIRTEPANFVTRNIARSSVAETYNVILEDLDYAIDKAPDFTDPVYISRTAARALKARVLLYKGDYAEAATVADAVISSGARNLSPTFDEVFSDGFSSEEMIFMRATDETTYGTDRKKFTYGNRHAIAGPWFITLMTGDPRLPATFNTANNAILKVNQTSFFAPSYLLRLAEMYLIKAEGLARSGAPLDDAKAPLLEIKSRAFGSPQTSSATNTDELLDEIFEEIVKELAFENGSEWFAAIRFNKIMTLKPKVTSSNQYILPIPEAEILGNTLFGEQNPGY